MSTLVSVCVLDTSCSRLLVSWTVYSLQDERMTLGDLFEMVVARSEPSARVQERLHQDHHLDESRVGRTKDELDLVGDTCKSLFYLGEMRNP